VDTGRCGYERAGRASRHTRAERARMRNRSQSGFVPVAAEPRLWTDSSAAGTALPVAATNAMDRNANGEQIPEPDHD